MVGTSPDVCSATPSFQIHVEANKSVFGLHLQNDTMGADACVKVSRSAGASRRAGVRSGDRIVAVNGSIPVIDHDVLARFLKTQQQVQVSIVREEKEVHKRKPGAISRVLKIIRRSLF